MSARYVQPLRISVQFSFLVFLVWLGVCFYRFVAVLMNSAVDGAAMPLRPDGIDGFLPIAGLLGTVSWFKGNGINTVHPAAVILFLTIVVGSLLLRRSFCSWLCPVATVSEICWKLGFRLFKRTLRLPPWGDRLLRSIKYILLTLFVYVTTVSMSQEALRAFIEDDYHKVADVRLMYFFLKISPLALGIIVSLLVLSFLLRNPFCRYICPYGALLGVVAVISPVRVTRNEERCVACGVCSQVCPTHIDVMHKKTVTSPECIGCWRCVSHCRFNEALSMKAFGTYTISGIIFAVLVVLLFWGGTYCGKIFGTWHSSVPLSEYQRILAK